MDKYKITVISETDREMVKKQLQNIRISPEYFWGLLAKNIFQIVRIEELDNRVAAILKQEMLAAGGEAAVSREVANFRRGKSAVLLSGTLKTYKIVLEKLRKQPFGLRDLARQLSYHLRIDLTGTQVYELKCGRYNLTLSPQKPLLMGILNVTPDSFSDGGKYLTQREAVNHAHYLAANGADIIDIGGESTRPGARKISEKEEIRRIIPVVEKLNSQIKIPISVDTYKPKVAEVAIKAGACLINDVTGLRYENGAMATLAARYDLPVIIMHMKGNPRMMQLNPYYQDTVGEIKRFFESRIKLAISRGVNEKKIILDPGIGFGKTLQHNLEIFNRLSEFLSFGRPILIGPSRKSFIAAIVGNIPPQKREGGTIASCLWSVLNGASILRVHDVALVRQALLVFKSISTERR